MSEEEAKAFLKKGGGADSEEKFFAAGLASAYFKDMDLALQEMVRTLAPEAPSSMTSICRPT